MADEHPWAEVARDLGGEIYPSWSPQGPLVQVRMGDILVTADRILAEGLVHATRVRALFRNPGGFRFRVRSADVSTELGKLLFGMPDIAVGDKSFDRRFVVQGNDQARVRALFARPRIREIVGAHVAFNLVARRFSTWSSNWVTGDVRGLDELHCQSAGPPSAKGLAGLFELYREILEELKKTEEEGRDELGLFLSRLQARGGTISEVHLVLWDGNPARRAAAVELGRLGDGRAVPALVTALEDEDAELRGAAADALGALGDPRAVGPLIALLADRSRGGGGPIYEHASRALQALGEGGLVKAFHGALRGDGDPLRRCVGEHRVPVAQALVAAMEVSDPTTAEAAGRTLGLLGVMEALPWLRRVQRTTGWDRTREACRQAIAELDSMASLPRPAQPGPGGHDTLPRVAGEPENDPTTLPRAVTGDDDG